MRTLDPTFINKVANHPDVHKWMGIEGKIDATEVVSNPYNFTFVNTDGGFILIQQSEGIYEVHSQFLPNKRKNVVPFMHECFEFMFCNTNCVEILTQLPKNNLAAVGLGRIARFRPIFERKETPRGPTTFARITLDEWVQDTDKLELEGQWFHTQLHRELGEQTHPYDPAHDRAVGATVKMVKAGNCVKAVDYYNKWAKFAGYAPITLINDLPPVIDVVDAIVSWNGKEMEILSCR